MPSSLDYCFNKWFATWIDLLRLIVFTRYGEWRDVLSDEEYQTANALTDAALETWEK